MKKLLISIITGIIVYLVISIIMYWSFYFYMGYADSFMWNESYKYTVSIITATAGIISGILTGIAMFNNVIRNK